MIEFNPKTEIRRFKFKKIMFLLILYYTILHMILDAQLVRALLYV